MSIVIAILIFSVIIIVHEFGHFILARVNGIHVEEFSLGLGPTLFGKQIGDTFFCLKLLPFGGACMMGEDDADDLSEGSFNSKSVWARMSVIAAGPVFNLILAWILCSIMVGWAGYRSTEISGVSEGYGAAEQGLQAGDRITKIGGRTMHIWNDITLYTLMHHQEDEVEITYERDGERYHAVVQMKMLEEDTYPKLGIISPLEMEQAGFFQSIQYGAYTVKYWMNYTFDSLKMLLTGQVGVKDLSGPVGIVNAVGEVYESSAPEGMKVLILNLMNFSVLITANLGIMNLLPIPALDGGRLVFLIVEAVRRKRIPPEKEGMVHFAGFALLMVLMIIVMFNDIIRLF